MTGIGADVPADIVPAATIGAVLSTLPGAARRVLIDIRLAMLTCVQRGLFAVASAGIGTGSDALADIVPDTEVSAALATLSGTALDGLARVAWGGPASIARVAPADVALVGPVRAAQVPHRLAARAPAPLRRCARAATGVLRAGVGSLALWLLVGVRVGHALPLALAER